MSEESEFWQGDFGNQYTARQKTNVAALRKFFANAMAAVSPPPDTILELGAGAGHNLLALRREFHRDAAKDPTTYGVEVNHEAWQRLQGNSDLAIEGDAIDSSTWQPEATTVPLCDLVLTKGFLIHVAPIDLPAAYDVIAGFSRRWVLLAEYFNPQPREIEYRGNANKLWARDFADDFLKQHPEFALVNYGFHYHRDPFPQDNITWWLMERQA